MQKSFHSIRPVVPLPPETTPLSAATYALSLQLTTPWPHLTAIIDSETGHKVSYSKVPPAELEQLLHSHPEIVDAAVIP